MKKVILSFCILFGSLSFGQNGTIKGKITDKLSEKPLQGVIIQLVNSNNTSSETDENGNFKLQNISNRSNC